ncbi:MAG: hypothetical protein PHC61_03360 [Chitinivibrionales bacterium]|nr:hypothetical protein [Chitinivibrionales bacterium]
MSEIIKLLDKNSAVEAVRKLGEDDLRFLNRLIIERLKLIHQARATNALAKFSAGDRVSFEDNTGGRLSGIVTRLNKKSVTVIADGGAQWNVAPRMLKLEGRAWGEAQRV